MQKYSILWADDEIDLLKPHIMFLNKKGYDITPVNSAIDALELFEEQNFDIIFLDENMPGMTGLEALSEMKSKKPTIPVVMITKSEEEYIMEEAIGAKIDDYLIKPLNPNQILLSVKKILDNKRLVTEKTNQSYQQDFRNLSMAFNDNLNHHEWIENYKKLIFWELEIEKTENQSMGEVLEMQKNEANVNFVKYIEEHYESWLNNPDIEKPILSHQLMQKKVFPHLDNDTPLFFILIDNLRYDQWKMIEPTISELFVIEEEDAYFSILPTTTAYARNAIFSGMTPINMQKYHRDIWVEEDKEEGKNLHEEEFLKRQIKKNKLDIKFSYHKIITQQQGKQVNENFNNMLNNDFNALVYNFVDMLSHARTDVNMIRELMPDDAAFRSVTLSWFEHSPLLELLKKIAQNKGKVIITTDHGTIQVNKPYKIVGDKNVNTNLRYKQGKNLTYKSNKVITAKKPEKFGLPKLNLSTSYVFMTEDYFFVYPNKYNYYVSYFKETFQHGGVSIEEMIIPIVTLNPK